MPRLSSRWPALTYPAYRRMMAVRLATTFGIQVQIVAVGWQVYDLSREPLYLGLIGLVQFAPAVGLILLTGTVADRFQRRLIVTISLLVMVGCSLALAAITLAGVRDVWPFLALMGGVGVARAFLNPAMQALLPNLVAAEHLGNAVSLNSIAARTGASLGPLVGGLLYDASAAGAYAAVALMFLVAALLAAGIKRTGQRTTATGTLTSGFRYIWSTKVILGAVSLDIFALLMGGVTALLPVFARDILDAGPLALGMLRSAPAVGGMSVALYLGAFPMQSRVGKAMFATVALFAIAIIVFGLSTVLWVSVLALIVMGGADMASVYIRWTLVQLWTPDHVRGRVSAVIGASASGSTELGDFRAGVSAALIGPVAAVVIGGVSILALVLLWMRLFPELVGIRSLSKAESDERTSGDGS